MKNSYFFRLVFIIASLVLFEKEVFAADYLFGSPSVSAANNSGCVATNYTFTQSTANNNNAKIIIGAAVTITFPAGMNLTSATCAGSSFGGVGINCATWSISGQTITFQSPAAIGKNASFNIVIANVTNGSLVVGFASVSVINNSGGTNSYSLYSISTTGCPVLPPNDNCSGTSGTPVVLTPPAAGSSTCTTTNGTTFGATGSSQAVCSGNADDDVWYQFTANNATHQITVDGVAGFNAILQVFSGTCATPTSLACVNATGDDGIESSNLFGLTVGATYLVRIYHSAQGSGVLGSNSFTVCVTSTSPGPGTCLGIGAGNLGSPASPIVLGGTNYVSGPQTTCGAGNDLTTSNVTNICGSSLYLGGEDKVVIFQPTGSGNSSINLTSTGSWVGMMLYNGCPTFGGTCVASATSSSGNQSIGCAPLVAGQTYYLVVDSWPAPTCNPFNVTISPPTGGTPLGTTCANNMPLAIPSTTTNQSTLCYGNDITNSTPGVGTTNYLSGEDKVYTFTTTGPECIGITITGASTYYVGWHVFSGCPGGGGTLVGRAEGSSGGTLSGSVTVSGAGTYYLVVDTWASPSYVNYNIELVSLGSGPANDVCSAAVPVSLGATVGGDNNCSGSAGEPATPSCWFAGSLNTVWFTAVAPASGKLKIRVLAGSLTDPQMAVYSGTCGALTLVSGGCNEDVASCGFSGSPDAELLLTGLTSGATYYIRVDGYNNTSGTFNVFVDDGNNGLSAIPGQDCGDPNPVCQPLVAVSNPGYSGYGNFCDLPTSYCLASAERNVVWYRVPISGSGTFNFDIVPNDFNNVNESETDYDFGVWRIAQTGGVSGTDYFDCAQIASGSAPPVACNYSYLGVTGVGTAGNPPTDLTSVVNACPQCTPQTYNPAYYSGAYEPTINALAGDVYLIAVSNFSSSTSGFRMRFMGTAGIDYTAAVSTAGGLSWSGGDVATPNLWTDVDNWGGCVAPTCAINTYIQNFLNQPILYNGQVYNTQDITIGVGATLTLQAGSTLEICGNFTNNGTLNADPTSTIIFKGSGTQTISGSFTGTNSMGNLIIFKSTGTVVANSDIEVGGSFSTANTTSIFNSNGKYITVAGNFRNNNGDITYTNTGTTGTLEFNGTGAQVYAQGASQLNLNKVLVNNSAAAGAGVNLTGTIAAVTTSLGTIAAQAGTDMFIKANTGTLNLTAGTISTGGSITSGSATIIGNRVHVLNTAASSVSVGNTTSYVDGTIRRYHPTGAGGAFNWPVGKAATSGYQRALTNFTAISDASYIDCRFSSWPSTPPYTSELTECSVTYDLETENNGYWTFIPANMAHTYTYDCTLYPLNATNIMGSAWTIIKRDHLTSIDNTGWLLNGNCVTTSTSTVVSRNAMTNFSFMGVDQGGVVLPIEMLYFKGHSEGSYNVLEWETVTERENDYFNLERSKDGSHFEFMTQVDGAGNSLNNIYYTRNDYKPFNGITYYRLKQVDFNGTVFYSNIVALENKLNEIYMSTLFPNPTTASTSFNFYTPIKGELSIKVFDQTGRLVIDKISSINEGTIVMDIDTKELASGVYNVEVKFDKGNFSMNDKLVKKY